MSSGQPRIHSPFLQYSPATKENQLAVLHLKRDLHIPTTLRCKDIQNEGYDEGNVTNTRFGSFPHSTLIGISWGSQIRASAVDTGSRGRREEGKPQKRKRDHDPHENGEIAAPPGEADVDSNHKTAVEASSGFIHLLPPTPEIWTTSLPHRTQVVYTPDYSYILHRIRARPGVRLLEAGAGSGSFTHAAARAVFNGYPKMNESPPEPTESRGKVWSFEFHDQRVQKLKQEVSEHGLDDLVELTHRDVCDEGFIPDTITPAEMGVSAVFLDLPAPWLAFKHLRRDASSPLNHDLAVHMCTFSPCIEQVQKTISQLRQFGWVEIEMIEIAAKRIEVRRERVGLQEEGLRGVNDSPATVDEALTRLREVDSRARVFREEKVKNGECAPMASREPSQHISKQQRLAKIRDAQDGRKVFKEGRLIAKAELDLKTHTSYLVFAVLPRTWTESDEQAALEAHANGIPVESVAKPMSKRQMKRGAREAAEGSLADEEAGRPEGNTETDIAQNRYPEQDAVDI